MNATLDLGPECFDGIDFSESGLERFHEVVRFLESLEGDHIPVGDIKEEYRSRLMYLNDYGGCVSETDSRHRFRVALGRDFAPYSFTIVWSQLNLSDGVYHYFMNGGLIWHGGSNDPLCTSLTPQYWGIHT